jgi:predicted secreted Zn-dependent protease
MTDFFDSDIVQNELKSINSLQEEVYNNIMNFSSMSKENKFEHIKKLNCLIEKQKIMYVRLSLSNDPKALKVKQKIQRSLELMGFSSQMDMNSIFDAMDKTIKSLKENLDNEASR